MPVFRSLLASSLVLVLAGAESFGQPAPTCKEPIVLGGEPPIVRRQSAANLANHIQSSPCLPFPHPGGELYFSWKPPRPGNYLIAVRPIAGEANVTLALWRGCPGANGSCLAGADAAGPGEPEAMQVRGADGGPNLPVYTIIVDSSVLGAPLDEVEVRIEELATPDVEVADARAPHPQAFQLALQSFQSVWEADQQRLRVLGVASRQALDALAVQGVGVRSVPVDRSPVQATPVPEPPNLRFDRFRYDLAGLSKAHLYLDVEGGELPNPPAVHVAGESDDVEAVKLVWD
ncbi:MAG: hypothetical protein HY721_25930, partial [Planctomycetes bacterium]|nr:hypothetical protein [Planctomycetota bacterium]